MRWHIIAKKYHITNASRRTIERAIRAARYDYFRPNKKPRLTKKNKQQRYEFACQHIGFDWSNVIFTDESIDDVGKEIGGGRYERVTLSIDDPDKAWLEDCVTTTKEHGVLLMFREQLLEIGRVLTI